VQPLWRERILWNPSRPVPARAAWAAALIRLALAPAFLIIALPIRGFVPHPRDNGSGNFISSWSGSITSTITSANGSSLWIGISYLPPDHVLCGFVRPYAEALLDAKLTTSSGTWIAPDGTPQREVIKRASNAGVFVGDMPNGKSALLQLPGRAATEFFGVPKGQDLPVGTHRAIVWPAVAYDAVYALALLMPLYASLAAARMIFTSAAERKTLRLSRGLCGRCRYDRAGLDNAAACPECGEVPSADTSPSHERHVVSAAENI
jgi:hypothetical protein